MGSRRWPGCHGRAARRVSGRVSGAAAFEQGLKEQGRAVRSGGAGQGVQRPPSGEMPCGEELHGGQCGGSWWEVVDADTVGRCSRGTVFADGWVWLCALRHVLSQGLSEWVQGVGEGVPVGSQSRWSERGPGRRTAEAVAGSLSGVVCTASSLKAQGDRGGELGTDWLLRAGGRAAGRRGGWLRARALAGLSQENVRLLFRELRVTGRRVL